MKILVGSLSKDEGEILIDGKPVNIRNPRDGMNLGISIIYQELMLVNDLTVAENIFIDNLNSDGKVIKWKKAPAKGAALFGRNRIFQYPRDR